MNSLWWQWQAPATSKVTISTKGSDFDTTLAVYTGTGLNNLVLVASNDDADKLSSAVTFDATIGTFYQIAVDGFASAIGNITLELTSTPDIDQTFNLDIDGNGIVRGSSDGLLIIRYLSNFRGDDLIEAGIGENATRTDSRSIENFLLAGINSSALDIDGNNSIDTTTDGLLILRYLFGFRDKSLIDGAIGVNSIRTTAIEIENYLLTLFPFQEILDSANIQSLVRLKTI